MIPTRVMLRARVGKAGWCTVLLAWAAVEWAVTPAVGQKLPTLPWVTRGAYLQCGTSNSVVIRWRTAVATRSVVRYGLEPGNLCQEARSPGRFKDHTVHVSGLAPGTKYYYGVGGARRVLQSGPDNYFVTAPAGAREEPIRVWVLGDPGTGFTIQKAVRDAYLRSINGQRPDLILTLGDNAYRFGTDYQFQRGFFDVYRQSLKHTFLWPALGNHDAHSADSDTESGVYFDVFTLPRRGQAGGVASGTEAYYSFTYGNAHFICLDSEDSDLSSGGEMVNWLRRDLAQTRADWIIAYWHHPPFSKGNHDSDWGEGNDLQMIRMREQVLPVLEAASVDLVLCGHTHLYERSFPLRGHYGYSTALESRMILERRHGRPDRDGPYRFHSTSTSRGTIYVNAGSSGHATEEKDLRGLNHPVMAVSLNLAGSLALEIKERQLEAVFLDDQGVRRDWFGIVK